jgi:murein DD-endopeptidase MepM/ murein hydrolase activator NlpD
LEPSSEPLTSHLVTRVSHIVVVSQFALLCVLLGIAVADGEPEEARPELSLPLDCRLGVSCWVANYVDVDPSGAAQDFLCRPRTYDGHTGVDFAIRDGGVMHQGVLVLAAAPGRILRLRDGVEDVGKTASQSPNTIAGRECGNGVLIDHGHGWTTQYCHLKRHSLRVKVGQLVDRGNVLGFVGLSGNTEFPHVHLTVRYHEQVFDPFTGQSLDAGCGAPARPLWRESIHIGYEPVDLYHAGFSSAEPSVDAIRQGQLPPNILSADSGALILWVDIFGVQSDDRIRFRITSSDGHVLLNTEQRVPRTQARSFSFAGLRRPNPTWAKGRYQGDVTLSRMDGETLLTRVRSVTVQIEHE